MTPSASDATSDPNRVAGPGNVVHPLPGNDFDHHSNFSLRAMKELHVGFAPVPTS